MAFPGDTGRSILAGGQEGGVGGDVCDSAVVFNLEKMVGAPYLRRVAGQEGGSVGVEDTITELTRRQELQLVEGFRTRLVPKERSVRLDHVVNRKAHDPREKEKLRAEVKGSESRCRFSF